MDDKLQLLLNKALGTRKFASVTEVGADWMPANQVWSLLEDPALIWLRYYGAPSGLYPDEPPYSLPTFLAKKKRQFRNKWVAELAPAAPAVCPGGYDLYYADALLETCQLLLKGEPVIVLPALWLAGARVFGKPDFLVHTSWLVFVNQKARHLIIKKRVSWMDERLKEIMRKRVNRS